MISRKSFTELFKKYRLRSEFATFSQLGMALAEKGLIYEDSIFSHWQKGDRIPNRHTILRLIEIFSERQSLKTVEQANEFLESADQGYLTKLEVEKISLKVSETAPFQIPNQIDNFTGREELIKEIGKSENGNILLIHGAAGVGKSSLAIRLGYLLRSKFPDGVLWYRLDTSDVMDILLSIAFAFGADIGHIQDKEIRASFVRSLLSKKKVLLIFDNVESNTDIRPLLPNSENCSVVITSRSAMLSIPTAYKSILIETFTQKETISLFKTILGEKYVLKHKSQILQLADIIGNFPLALHIFAKEIKRDSLTIEDLIKRIEEDLISLEDLLYEDKNLFIAIDVSYKLLNETVKKVFISLAIFNGKDFSVESVAYINELPVLKVKKILDDLKNISLIEESTKNRFRIHPIIKRFVRKKLDNPTLFIKAAKYYEQFLAKFDKRILKSYPNIKQESDNVIYVFKKCYELQYWDEVITLWDPLETLLYATHQLNKMRYLFQIVKAQKTGINIFQKILIAYFCFLIIYWILLYSTGLKTSFWNYIWNTSLALVPLIGGIKGFFIAKSWGLWKSSIGKAVLFLSCGLFSWGVGNVIWTYYNIFESNPIPYPSLADAGYLPSYFLWTAGMIYLPHAIGGKFGFRRWYSKFLVILIPVLVLALSYYLVAFITKSTIIFASFTSYTKLFFDIAYPVSDAIILTTALVVGTSFKFFGGKYRLSIYTILLSFCFQYIADFLFSYTTTANTYYNGAITDSFFVTGLSLLTFGVLGFHFQSEKKL